MKIRILSLIGGRALSKGYKGTIVQAGNRDDNGMTALMWAAADNQNPDVINRLLKAGADAKAKDNQGKSAFDYAQDNAGLNGTYAERKLEDAATGD